MLGVEENMIYSYTYYLLFFIYLSHCLQIVGDTIGLRRGLRQGHILLVMIIKANVDLPIIISLVV